jgi:hypothetical protein
MQRFDRLGDRFFEQIIVDATGAKTRGILSPPSEGDLSGQLNPPRLILRVRDESIIQTGHIIRTRSGLRYLVAEHADVEGHYRAHKLFLANRRVTWLRSRTTEDVLTGQAKSLYDQDLGFIWVNWELIPREELDVNLRVTEDRIAVLTAAAVRLGDKLDGQIVKRLNPRLGVNAVEVQ